MKTLFPLLPSELAGTPLREIPRFASHRRLACVWHGMNQAIAMHDSECRAVEVGEEGRGSVLLDAYVHRTAGEPGVSPGEGGVQRIRIKIDAMTVEGDVGTLPSYVYEGSLTVG